MKIFSGLQIKFKSVKTIKIYSKYELILPIGGIKL